MNPQDLYTVSATVKKKLFNLEFKNIIISCLKSLQDTSEPHDELFKESNSVGNTTDISQIVIRECLKETVQIKEEIEEMDIKLFNLGDLNEECDLPSLKDEADDAETFSNSKIIVKAGKTESRSTTIKNKYSCLVCGKSLLPLTSRRSNMSQFQNCNNSDQHTLTKSVNCTTETSNLNMYKCKICFRQFSLQFIKEQINFMHNYSKQNLHLLSDIDPKQQKTELNQTCDKCADENVCIGTQNIKNHQTDKLFKDKLYFSELNKRKHCKTRMFSHTMKKLLTCKICFTEFIRKDHLFIHMQYHSGERPFKCGLCIKVFTEKYNLNVHMRHHTGEKPYKCIICFKDYAYRESLNVHMRQHTGKKPFKCEMCFKEFRQKSNLNVHMQRHKRLNY